MKIGHVRRLVRRFYCNVTCSLKCPEGCLKVQEEDELIPDILLTIQVHCIGVAEGCYLVEDEVAL